MTDQCILEPALPVTLRGYLEGTRTRGSTRVICCPFMPSPFVFDTQGLWSIPTFLSYFNRLYKSAGRLQLRFIYQDTLVSLDPFRGINNMASQRTLPRSMALAPPAEGDRWFR